MLESGLESRAGASAAWDSALEPSEAADWLVDGVIENRFLVVPHRAVLADYVAKGQDYDAWVSEHSAPSYG